MENWVVKSQRVLNLLWVIALLPGLLVGASGPAAADELRPPWPTSALPQMAGPSAQPAGPVVARVYVRDRAHLDAVAGTLDIWEVHMEDKYVLAALQPAQYQRLAEAGYRLEIDAQRTERMNMLAPLDARFYYFDNDYANPNNRYMVNFLQEMNALYPALVELVDIGNAWQASHGGHQRDLWVLRITNEDPAYGPIADKPAFFMFGGIHAREVAIPELAIRYIQYLLAGYNDQGGYNIDPDVTWLVNHNVIYVLVSQNPDGHRVNEQDINAYRRKNLDNDDGCSTLDWLGVDLNRNHSFFWNCCGGSSGDPCDDTYRGPGAGSEPETQAFQNYFATVMRDQNGPNDDNTVAPASPLTTTGIFLSLHSYSDVVLWPWDITPSPPNEAQLQAIGRKLAYFNGYNPSGGIGYTVDGATDDWTYGKLGIASFTIEVGSGYTCGDFFPPYGCIDGIDGMPRSFWAENQPVFTYLHKIARTPYMTVYGPDTGNVAPAPSHVERGAMVTLTATIADQRYGSDPLQPVAAAEYFVDAPGQDGAGAAMAPADGAWGGTTENVVALVNSGGLTLGQHYILVHGRNSNGDWGPFTAAFVWVTAEPDSAISGVVRDGVTGNPVNQADVSLYGGGAPQFAVTGPDGAFAFDVFSGTYDLSAVAYGYYSATVNVAAVTGLTTTQDISLTAIPQGTISGRISEAVTGLPLAAAVVAVSDYTTLQTTSDPATGDYSLPAFVGVYTITASAPGHVPQSADVTVVAGYTTTQDLTLESQACLLLVDDDGGQSYEDAYHTALTDAGYFYQTWNVAAHGSPPLSALSSYGAVLWFTADNRDAGYPWYTFSPATLAALTAYVDGGGSLLLAGHNVNAGNYSTTLFSDRLATSYGGSLPSTDDYALSGGGLFAGLDGLLARSVYTNPIGFTPDVVDPVSGASRVFTYSHSVGAGVAYDAGGYRAINLGFGLEAISDPVARTAVLARGIEWLGCPAAPIGLRLAKHTAQDAIPAGGQLAFTFTLTNNSLVAATGIVVSDTLPAYTGFIGASHDGGVEAGQAIWHVDRLDPMAHLVFTLTVSVGDAPQGTQIVNADYGAAATQASTVWTSGPVTATVSGQVFNPPVAGFVSSAPVPVGQAVVFTNTTQGLALITYTWSFGDASSPVTQLTPQQTIAHIYTQAGWYTVTLTATNKLGTLAFSDAFSDQIEITWTDGGYKVYLPILLKNQ